MEKVIDSTFASNDDKQTLLEQNNKIQDAYSVFKKLDVLKSPEYEWNQCVQEYETKIEGMIRRAMKKASDQPRENVSCM